MTEDIIGQGVQIGPIINLLVFGAVIFFQIKLLIPLFGNWGFWNTTEKETMNVGEVVEDKSSSPIGGITYNSEDNGQSIPGNTGKKEFDLPVYQESTSEGNSGENDSISPGISEGVKENEKEKEQKTIEQKSTQTDEKVEKIATETETENQPVPDVVFYGDCLDCKIYNVKGRFTYYYPDLYPGEFKKIQGSNYVRTINCWQFDLVNRKCVSKMASGMPWEAFIDIAVACPKEYPFGTRVIIPALGREYICLDRGSMVCTGGVCDFDILSKTISFSGNVYDVILAVPGW